MITNKTKNKVLSEKEIICRSTISQMRGLMFRKKQNLIMEFSREKKVSLHMFFVFYPIDVLILDKNKMIVEIKKNFRPFTFWSSEKKGMYAVELWFNSEYETGNKLEIKV